MLFDPLYAALSYLPLNTQLHERTSVNISAIYTYFQNYLHKLNENHISHQLSPSKFKIVIKKTKTF